jgi:hypothetical protein
MYGCCLLAAWFGICVTVLTALILQLLFFNSSLNILDIHISQIAAIFFGFLCSNLICGHISLMPTTRDELNSIETFFSEKVNYALSAVLILAGFQLFIWGRENRDIKLRNQELIYQATTYKWGFIASGSFSILQFVYGKLKNRPRGDMGRYRY